MHDTIFWLQACTSALVKSLDLMKTGKQGLNTPEPDEDGVFGRDRISRGFSENWTQRFSPSCSSSLGALRASGRESLPRDVDHAMLAYRFLFLVPGRADWKQLARLMGRK